MMSREDKLWELCKSRLKDWARIQRQATENERAIYNASIELYSMHDDYVVITNSYVSRKAIEVYKNMLQIIEAEITAGDKEEEARQAVRDALEYLDLVTWGRVRQPKGECRVF
jgi:hypothetical protein